jgi:hypothetical protein
MTSTRSYKKALPPDQARYELSRNSGTQFDAAVVRAFLNVSVGRRRGFAGFLSSFTGLPGVHEVAASVAGGGAATAGAAAAAAVVALSVPTTAPPAFGAMSDRPPVVTTVAPTGVPDDAGASGDGAHGYTPTGTAPAASGGGGGNDRETTTTTQRPGVPGVTTPHVSVPDTTVPDRDTVPTNPTVTVPPTNASTSTTTTTKPPSTTPPIARDDRRTVLVGTVTDINVLENDHADSSGPGSNELDDDTLRIVSGPATGTATIVGEKIRFSAPLLALLASTDIVYEICDTRGECARATLTITII